MGNKKIEKELVENILAKTLFMKKIRIAVIFGLMIIFLVYRFVLGVEYPFGPFISAIGVAFLVNAFFLVLEKYKKFETVFWPRIFSGTRTIIDGIILIFIVYNTGGLESPFLSFIFVSLIGFTLSNNNLTLIIFSNIIFFLLYSTILILLPYYHIISEPVKFIEVGNFFPAFGSIMTFGFTLALVSIMINFVVKLIEERELELVKSSQKTEESNLRLQKSNEEIDRQIKEVDKINKFMVGRELKMKELKTEVNELLKELGQPAKY